MKQRAWLIRYGVAVVLAILLAATLGQLSLFRDSHVAGTKLTAAGLTQVLGYGTALVLLWFATRRAARHFREDRTPLALLRHVLLPAVTLVITLLSYQVLWLLVGPFLAKPMKGVYNWLFIFATVGTAVWLGVAWFKHSEAVLEGLDGEQESRRRAS